MSQKQQTRRSVSISKDTYSRLKIYCEANKRSMSGVVEDLLKGLLGEKELRDVPSKISGSGVQIF